MTLVAEAIMQFSEFGALTQVDTWSGKVATVKAPTPSGRFYPAPKFWNPATNRYEDTPPTVLPGQTIGIVFYGKNTSDYPQRMRVDCDGRTGSVQTIQPGYVGAWEFQWSAPTTLGDVTVTAKLYAEYAG